MAAEGTVGGAARGLGGGGRPPRPGDSAGNGHGGTLLAPVAGPGTAPHGPPTGPAPPTSRELRSVLGTFATGVAVIAAGEREPCGMTANSFTSVSLDPPLVLVCVKQDAAVHRAILGARAFAVSVLSAGQEAVARRFADRTRPRGAAEFESVAHTPGLLTRAPVLDGALGWVECRLAAVYEGGDHSILLGGVLAAGFGADRGAARQAGAGALVFHDGAFHRFDPG